MRGAFASTLRALMSRLAATRTPTLPAVSPGGGAGYSSELSDPNVRAACDVLFDSNWYRTQTSMADPSVEACLAHYMRIGAGQNLSPHPLFDATWYRRQSPEIGENPLLHYVRVGAAQRLSPHPLFDAEWYTDRYADAAAAENPLIHFIREGVAKGYSPSVAFNAPWYLLCNPDVDASGMNPLVHFVAHGLKEGRLPNPYDEVALFQQTANNTDVVTALRLLDWRQHLLPRDETVPYVGTFGFSTLHDLTGTAPGVATLRPRTLPSQPGTGGASSSGYLTLRDATVIGGSTALLIGDNFVTPEPAPATNRCAPFAAYPQGWSVEGTAVVKFNRKSRTYVPRGIHATALHDDRYTVFVETILPILVDRSIGAIDPEVPFLATGSRHGRIASAWESLNDGRRAVIPVEAGVAYRTEVLYYPTPPQSGDGTDSASADRHRATLATMREHVLLRLTRPTMARARRVYVRPPGPSWRFATAEPIEAMLLDHGFEIVTMVDLDFRTQVRLLNDAALVVMHAGEDVANTVWCRAHTQICVIEGDRAELDRDRPLNRVVADLCTVTTIRLSAEVGGPEPETTLPPGAATVDAFRFTVEGMIEAFDPDRWQTPQPDASPPPLFSVAES